MLFRVPIFANGRPVEASLYTEDTRDLLWVATLAQRTSSVLERLRDSARSARADDRREPTFPIGKAADLVGRTPAAIRDAEKDGRLPPPPRTENNRRVGYTLAQLNDMRGLRSEEHTSELQSLLRISYAVFCLK